MVTVRSNLLDAGGSVRLRDNRPRASHNVLTVYMNNRARQPAEVHRRLFGRPPALSGRPMGACPGRYRAHDDVRARAGARCRCDALSRPSLSSVRRAASLRTVASRLATRERDRAGPVGNRHRRRRGVRCRSGVDFGVFGIEGRYDTTDIGFRINGTRYELMARTPVPVREGSVSLGAGRLDADRLALLSINARIRTSATASQLGKAREIFAM